MPQCGILCQLYMHIFCFVGERRRWIIKNSKHTARSFGRPRNSCQSFWGPPWRPSRVSNRDGGRFQCISSDRCSSCSPWRTREPTIPGPVGTFGTAQWKHGETVRLGNSMRAVSAGSSMGPSVRENLRPTGTVRWRYAGSARFLEAIWASLHQKETPGDGKRQ